VICTYNTILFFPADQDERRKLITMQDTKWMATFHGKTQLFMKKDWKAERHNLLQMQIYG